MEKELSPLVSIITITYNRADLIHRCVESIQKQTYRNYEHIIADGNSSDNTEEVVKGYNDPHIKYIKLIDRGPQIQMKAASDVARGKYITFLDDDDEYLPEKLEKQVNLFETEPQKVGMVYCWMSYYDAKQPDVVIGIHQPTIRGFAGDIAASAPIVCGTPTLMVRREIFNEIGGCYNDSIGYVGSDWELATRICQICDVDYLPESLIKVYVNHGHARLSTDFYDEKAKKGILFHKHFLTEFASVFDRHPEYAKDHYYQLIRCYARLRNRKEAYYWYKKYTELNPGLRSKLSSLKVIIIGH
jgi:glycosyltransferase involved in cell wall biosynthesis